MFGWFYDTLFFAIPAILILCLGISIYRYVSAKKQNEQAPGTVADDEIKRRKTVLILLSVVTGVLVIVVGGFLALLYMAVAFM